MDVSVPESPGGSRRCRSAVVSTYSASETRADYAIVNLSVISLSARHWYAPGGLSSAGIRELS